MAQQTALKWFLANLPDRFKNALITACEKEIEQAKEMEKEQIIDAHIEGQRVFDKHPHTQWTNDQAEQYYNETYKSDTR